VPLDDATIARATATGASPAARASAPALPAHVVLCVDNEPDILEGMHALLSRWGLKPCTAHDLHSAEETATRGYRNEQVWPRLLLVDYQLDHGRTGLEVIARLREVSGTEIPAAILTANRDPRVRELVEAAGHRLVYKPVKPAALRTLITRMVQKSRAA
jgi:CheY-like chemotaxis protein